MFGVAGDEGREEGGLDKTDGILDGADLDITCSADLEQLEQMGRWRNGNVLIGSSSFSCLGFRCMFVWKYVWKEDGGKKMQCRRRQG